MFGFTCCGSPENLSIHVSIATAGLILANLGRFQHFSTSQNTTQYSISLFFEKKVKFMSFHAVSSLVVV